MLVPATEVSSELQTTEVVVIRHQSSSMSSGASRTSQHLTSAYDSYPCRQLHLKDTTPPYTIVGHAWNQYKTPHDSAGSPQSLKSPVCLNAESSVSPE